MPVFNEWSSNRSNNEKWKRIGRLMKYNEDGINKNTYELLFKEGKNDRDIDE